MPRRASCLKSSSLRSFPGRVEHLDPQVSGEASAQTSTASSILTANQWACSDGKNPPWLFSQSQHCTPPKDPTPSFHISSVYAALLNGMMQFEIISLIFSLESKVLHFVYNRTDKIERFFYLETIKCRNINLLNLRFNSFNYCRTAYSGTFQN